MGQLTAPIEQDASIAAHSPSGAAASTSAAPVDLANDSELPVMACPHCSRRFRRRRTVARRASAHCPACNKEICIDPFQRLYPGQTCLSAEQAQYVVFLMRLKDMWCGAALVPHLDAVRDSLTSTAGEAPSASQILDRMLTVAKGRCVERDEEQMLRALIRDVNRFDRKCHRSRKTSRPWSGLRLLRTAKPA